MNGLIFWHVVTIYRQHPLALFDQISVPFVGGMSSLNGLVDDWDACPEVRKRMRTVGALFVKEDGKDKPHPNIPCASLNFHVLKPLVERLEESPGVLGMHSIPELTKQKPGQVISNFPVGPVMCFCFFVCV